MIKPLGFVEIVFLILYGMILLVLIASIAVGFVRATRRRKLRLIHRASYREHHGGNHAA